MTELRPVLPLISWLIFRKSLNLPEPEFLHMYKGEGPSTYHVGLW